ncbi:hypothetical protein RIEPE_0269 [Candidatus Riesia pediculicola USDA]|uniref:Uncharacterized protein n=1 Tax=Riesia pediculicola (strain USDA) TaxID=515618 RepID=D4G866_RIEPU|nr:hypothetical protein RIEPE_0269 [Candidatus Riesia pediculicola USDA]
MECLEKILSTEGLRRITENKKLRKQFPILKLFFLLKKTREFDSKILQNLS